MGVSAACPGWYCTVLDAIKWVFPPCASELCGEDHTQTLWHSAAGLGCVLQRICCIQSAPALGASACHCLTCKCCLRFPDAAESACLCDMCSA